MRRVGGAGAAVVLVAVLGVFGPPPAGADEKIFKYDQYDEDINTTANQIQGKSLSGQYAFAQSEGFGQIYRPLPGELPLTILGIDLFLSGPPNEPDSSTHATIDIWIGPGDGPAPPTEDPTFSIGTQDLLDPFATGDEGQPLVGNTVLQITFDPDDPDGHPPKVTEPGDNVWIVIHYQSPAQNLAEEWGNPFCDKSITCGCQPVGTYQDAISTSKANVFHILSGGCSPPANTWKWGDEIGAKGDILMRMRADVPGGGCTPSCAGKTCGSDGCGGVCGTCGGGTICTAGQCVAACEPACNGKSCGPDGCGGVCGTCGANQVCQNQVCVDDLPPCTPDCFGLQCGSDGCGGSCGTCGDGEGCVDGLCKSIAPPEPDVQPEPDATTEPDAASEPAGPIEPDAGPAATLRLDSVTPDHADLGEQLTVTLSGEGFLPGALVRIGGQPAPVEDATGDSLLEVLFKGDLDVGLYDVTVINPDDETSTLPKAFEVRQTTAVIPSGTASRGCGAAGREPGTLPALAFALLALFAGLTIRRW